MAEPKDKSRLVICDTTYFQAVGEQPVSVPSRYTRWLSTADEQPYRRKLKIGEAWQPLDPQGHCWLEGVSRLSLSNEEGEFRQVNPTVQERADAMAKVVEVAILDVPFALVRPLESMQMEPFGWRSLRVRCRQGEAKCTLTLFPE